MTEINNCPICGTTDLQIKIQTQDFSVTGELFNIVECDHCELLITSPRPANQDLNRYYQSEHYVSHTSKATNLTNRLYLLVRSFTLKNKLSLVNKNCIRGALLDYGCGTGDFLNILSEDDWTVFGIEPSLQAREIALSNNPNIFESIEDLPNEKFNAITLWHVLEHVSEPNFLLKQLQERLYNNGRIFIAVPNFNSHDAKHYEKHWAGLDVPRHLWHFSTKAMENLLQNNGLKIASIKPMYFDAPYVSMLSEKYKANNKANLTTFIKGASNGVWSNIKAFFSNQYSSLIYIVKK
jgi:2-polyprenyl-3-methyl-5-hydroxy-6-metoxy-1,4-benzoquinol methylase